MMRKNHSNLYEKKTERKEKNKAKNQKKFKTESQAFINTGGFFPGDNFRMRDRICLTALFL